MRDNWAGLIVRVACVGERAPPTTQLKHEESTQSESTQPRINLFILVTPAYVAAPEYRARLTTKYADWCRGIEFQLLRSLSFALPTSTRNTSAIPLNLNTSPDRRSTSRFSIAIRWIGIARDRRLIQDIKNIQDINGCLHTYVLGRSRISFSNSLKVCFENFSWKASLYKNEVKGAVGGRIKRGLDSASSVALCLLFLGNDGWGKV